MRIVVLGLVALCAAARPAAAHQTSVKYIALALDPARGTIAVTIRAAPNDLTDPLGLPVDSQPTAAVAAASPAVAPFVAHWIAIATTAGPCIATAPSIAPVNDGRLVAVSYDVACPGGAGALDELHLDFSTFFALDKRHEAIVRRTSPDDAPVDAIVRTGDSPFVLRPHTLSLSAWIRAGMDHIYSGRDHIAFVLALLLVVMLAPGARTGGTVAWQLRGFAKTLRSTAGVITAFTVAHSLSLIAASLGWVHLPGRLVEALIAVSIAYTAIEDIVRPDVRWRFALTFGFGLVHGLGFASVLAEQLPPHDVLAPLLCFNVGVELGQLTIVAVVLPIFYVIARAAGAAAYRARIMPILAGIIAVLGVNWVCGRVFGVALLPWTEFLGM